MEKNGGCLSLEMTLVYASLAAIDGFISISAAIQVFYLRPVFSISQFDDCIRAPIK
jgi:hypothetical protein